MSKRNKLAGETTAESATIRFLADVTIQDPDDGKFKSYRMGQVITTTDRGAIGLAERGELAVIVNTKSPQEVDPGEDQDS